ncbi:MAG: PD40 domain-containing protein [Candidatus Eisenbacteria bacterium]|nr:PD40 domain-containing protein [Candidatus Eisenbacteria bacterium]
MRALPFLAHPSTKRLTAVIGISFALVAVARAEESGTPSFRSGRSVDHLIREGETHFTHLYQLTNGGENAEAYFSWDGAQLILQVTPRGGSCDQIYTMPSGGGDLRLVSTGKGVTTCSYFFPNGDLLYASTHLGGDGCPTKPDRSKGYVWALFPDYDVWKSKADGSGLTRLTDSPGYDAEATVGPDGDVIFTSVRDGDIDLYRMKSDGSDVRRLTNLPGYDGGAFFSYDGTQICWRASRPQTEEEVGDFRKLLADGLVRPSKLEIFVGNADGTEPKQLTNNGAANFCPFFHPSGKKVMFSSNLGDPKGRNFDLYLVDIESKEIERVTQEETFDGFCMFSPDGKRLVFASNRGAEVQGETNIFMADWQE